MLCITFLKRKPRRPQSRLTSLVGGTEGNACSLREQLEVTAGGLHYVLKNQENPGPIQLSFMFLKVRHCSLFQEALINDH